MFGNVRRVTLLVSSVKDSCLLGRDRLITIFIDFLFLFLICFFPKLGTHVKENINNFVQKLEQTADLL